MKRQKWIHIKDLPGVGIEDENSIRCRFKQTSMLHLALLQRPNQSDFHDVTDCNPDRGCPPATVNPDPFVFLPKLIQRGMKADVDVVIKTFGKNEQAKKVFWTFFISMAGLVLARVVDPATAQQIVGMIMGMGG